MRSLRRFQPTDRHVHTPSLIDGMANFLAMLLAPAGLQDEACASTRQHLAKGQTLWIIRPLGREVFCLDGRLWLCFDGVLLDVVLDPGESHRCQSRSPLSIHALSAAAMRVA